MSVAFASLGAGANNYVTSDADKSIDIEMPADTADGDLLVAIISTGKSSSIADPAGWSVDFFDDMTNNWYVAWKIASSETGPYTFDHTAGGGYGNTHGVILRFTGAAAASSLGNVASAVRGYDDVVDIPTIDIAGAGSGLVLAGAKPAYSVSCSACSYSGATERYDAYPGDATAGSLFVYTADNVAAGATGAKTMTISAETLNKYGLALEIKPDAAAGGHPAIRRFGGIPFVRPGNTSGVHVW